MVAAGMVHWISVCFEDKHHFDGFKKEAGGLGSTVFSSATPSAAPATVTTASASAAAGASAAAAAAAASSGPVPFRVALLCDVAEHHVLLRDRVMEVLLAALEREYALDALLAVDLRRVLMGGLVFLVCLGTHALAVLAHVRTRLDAHQIDVSLARHGVTEMLRLLRPPYSRPFAAELMRLLDNDALLDGLHASDNDHNHLDAFLRACDGLVDVPDSVSAAVRGGATISHRA